MAISGVLAISKITAGWLSGSNSTLADGFESASDVLASGVVLFGLIMASRPADAEHPYGHGRLETLSGFTVGWLLVLIGVAISVHSMRDHAETHPPPAAYAAWPLMASILAKSVLSAWKFRWARRSGSSGLKADAWNDSVDILSGTVALSALGLTLYDPTRYLSADHYGGLCVGLIVVYLGLRVVYETTRHLMDTMPDDRVLTEIRRVALTVPGALGVEKCYARKTGLQYHVDLHLEVDPDMTVRRSHEIASEVRDCIKDELDWVADVLVHVEPHGM